MAESDGAIANVHKGVRATEAKGRTALQTTLARAGDRAVAVETLPQRQVRTQKLRRGEGGSLRCDDRQKFYKDESMRLDNSEGAGAMEWSRAERR